MVVISELIPDTLYTLRVEAITEDNRILEVGDLQVTTTTGLHFCALYVQ